jgi:hypothetical protein
MVAAIDPAPLYNAGVRLLERPFSRMDASSALGPYEYDIGLVTVGVRHLNGGRYAFRVRLGDGRIFCVFKNQAQDIHWGRPLGNEDWEYYIPDEATYAELRLVL